MSLKSISIEVDELFVFRTMASRNLVKQLLEPSTESSDNLRLCLSYASNQLPHGARVLSDASPSQW
jgi:hypothetical protein